MSRFLHIQQTTSLFAILLYFLCTLSYIHTQTSNTSTTGHIILIDAGSSGSRIHIHKYETQPNALPIIHPSINKKIKPGLSSYTAKPTEAVTGIKELVEYAMTQIDATDYKHTSIHLHATAGLRSIEQSQATAILDAVRDYIQTTEFMFERDYAKVITGQQEGINGWLAANYLLGNFDSGGDTPQSTTGVVEMGGASMQLTYAPTNPTTSDQQHLHRVTIGGYTYWLYSYSYLQYGLQAAEKLFQRTAIDQIELSGNPCYPKSYKHSSTGNYDECLQLMTVIFDKTTQCESTCSFNGIYQPNLASEQQQFIAIENFYYTLQFFNGLQIETEHNNKVVTALKLKGKEYCATDWNDIKHNFDKIATQELGYYCFAAAYQAKVLEHGFGFELTNKLQAVHDISAKPIDWALGAVLVQLLEQSMSTNDIHVTSEENADVVYTDMNQKLQDTSNGVISNTFTQTCTVNYIWMFSTVILSIVLLYQCRHNIKRLVYRPQQNTYNGNGGFQMRSVSSRNQLYNKV